jgi:hypothetical protein
MDVRETIGTRTMIIDSLARTRLVVRGCGYILRNLVPM